MVDVPQGRSPNDEGRDSLDLVERVMELEEGFDINISDEDAEKLLTVQDAIRYIAERRPLLDPRCGELFGRDWEILICVNALEIGSICQTLLRAILIDYRRELVCSPTRGIRGASYALIS